MRGQKSYTVNGDPRSSRFFAGIGAVEPALQNRDLSIMMGFVLANVEPFTQIVGWAPWKFLVDGHQPPVIAIFQFGQGRLARFTQRSEIVVKIISLALLPRRLSEVHGDIPFSFELLIVRIPIFAFERVKPLVSIRGRQMQQQGSDGIGIVVPQMIQVCLR